eukprot:TRINITY_DN2827_c0_g1_i2.p1 TRINITY_DN2827_c0_g1~~TRINITY_DN2827_c0_g1_i2.p1  ORF type:complete len:412 (+),score=115.55 TRINITY_DN2827_c0_g1_i2:74-1309(+)
MCFYIRLLKPPVLKAVNPASTPQPEPQAARVQKDATTSPTIPSQSTNSAESQPPVVQPQSAPAKRPDTSPSTPAPATTAVSPSKPASSHSRTPSSARDDALIPDLLGSFDGDEAQPAAAQPAASQTSVPTDNLLGDDFVAAAPKRSERESSLLDLDFNEPSPSAKSNSVAIDPLDELAQAGSRGVPLAAQGMHSPLGFDMWDTAFSGNSTKQTNHVSLDDFAQQSPQMATSAAAKPQLDDLLSFGKANVKQAPRTPVKADRPASSQAAATTPSGDFDRERLREEKNQLVQDRIEKARQDHLDQERRAAEEREIHAQLDEEIKVRVESWAANKQNLRALLASLHEILWADSGWKEMKMSELLSPTQVKKGYHKALVVAHPDKVTGGTHEQQVLVKLVFDKLRAAYEKLKEEL